MWRPQKIHHSSNRMLTLISRLVGHWFSPRQFAFLTALRVFYSVPVGHKLVAYFHCFISILMSKYLSWFSARSQRFGISQPASVCAWMGLFWPGFSPLTHDEYQKICTIHSTLIVAAAAFMETRSCSVHSVERQRRRHLWRYYRPYFRFCSHSICLSGCVVSNSRLFTSPSFISASFPQ